MANDIKDFTSIVLANPKLIRSPKLIQSLALLIKNTADTVLAALSHDDMRDYIRHFRTYGSIPDPIDTAPIQSALSDIYTQYCIVANIVPDPTIITLIADNDAVIINNRIHISQLWLSNTLILMWYTDMVADGTFTGTIAEFRVFIFNMTGILDTVPFDDTKLTWAVAVNVFTHILAGDIHSHPNNIDTKLTLALPTNTVGQYTDSDISVDNSTYPLNIVYDISYLNNYAIEYTSSPIITAKLNTISQFAALMGENIISVNTNDEMSLTGTHKTARISSKFANWKVAEESNSTAIAIPYVFDHTELDTLLLNVTTDYYTNHSAYISDPAAPAYIQNHVANVRSNISLHYSKVLDMLNMIVDEYTINFRVHIDKVVTLRTQDIITLTSMNRSIAAVTLAPVDIGGVLYNSLTISFDNYNPDFSYLVADNITDSNNGVYEFTISVSKEIYEFSVRDVHTDTYYTESFSRGNALYSGHPMLLFLGIPVIPFKVNSNVLEYVKVYAGHIDSTMKRYMISSI